MALSLASSLIRCGTFNPANVACSYVFWSQSKPPDIGKATRNALTIGIQIYNTVSCYIMKIENSSCES